MWVYPRILYHTLVTSARGRKVSRSEWCSPALTSGSQWHRQLARRTPPPRLSRKLSTTFCSRSLPLLRLAGSVVSIEGKSYLTHSYTLLR